MSYRAPVADILYSLNHVAGFAAAVDAGPVWRSRPRNRRIGDRRSRQIRHRRAGAARCRRRPRRRALRQWGRDHADRLPRRLSPLGRGRLGRGHRQAGIRRHGPAACGRRRLQRNVVGRVDGLRALSAAGRRRDRRARDLRRRNAARDLSRPPRLGRMDRDDEPHRAAGRLRPQRGQDARRARARRDLSPHRPEDLHHLRRTRHGRQHRPSRAGAPARRAARHARHLAVPGAEVSRQAGRLAGAPQRRALRFDRAQTRHPRVADLRHGLWRRWRRDRLSGRRGEPRPCRDVRDDERGAARRRPAGRGDRREGLSEGARVCARTSPGPRRRRRHEPDRRASRRQAHVGRR